MILTEKHLVVLKDINRFSRVKRYHGLLPKKHTAFYESGVLRELLTECLIEKGTVHAPCGSMLKGYRLSATAGEQLTQLGIRLDEPLEQDISESAALLDELSEDHIQLLKDIHHYSQIRKFCGIMPKDELHGIYRKKDAKILYDLGLILYIKLKGVCSHFRKGYILSEGGRDLLRQIGTIG